ncbi:hypothetical protein FRACYDRAFT_152079, partial [Fragilariopsis cylindrus CCMP1102]
PIREDDSIFMSIAAFREHLLADTLAYAFSNAKHPEKLFIGAVVQNCFGKNGIEDFCAMSDYTKYCTNGQIRVIYMHESESLGPAMARYYASKLWGGETFFVQTDSHLKFAVDWDEKYRNEIKLTKNYPKSILSSYPPGFEQKHFIPKGFNGTLSDINNTVVESPGCRLWEPRPSQIPFIAAGFFFTRSEILKDIPFDPFLPWTFMGEEISLSLRAWTHGWNMYAPRKNLIIHQY